MSICLAWLVFNIFGALINGFWDPMTFDYLVQGDPKLKLSDGYLIKTLIYVSSLIKLQ